MRGMRGMRGSKRINDINTRVRKPYIEDAKLGRWVTTKQRTTYKSKKMMEERKRRLDSVGFVWKFPTKNQAKWEGRNVPATSGIRNEAQECSGPN